MTKKKLLAVLAVLIVGLGGWWMYANSKDNTQSNNSDTANQSAGDLPKASTETSTKDEAPDPTEGGKYLVIKEWGVRFEVPESLRGDISYYINDRAQRDFGSDVFVSFLSKKVSSGSMKCAVNESDTPRDILAMMRYQTDTAAPIEPKPFKEFPDKKLSFTLTDTGCGEAAERENNTEAKQIIDQLRSAITSSLELM